LDNQASSCADGVTVFYDNSIQGDAFANQRVELFAADEPKEGKKEAIWEE